MDDTKKIIERYKRELMEMSRASGSVKTPVKNSAEGGTDNSAAAEKKPQVIGYVSGDSKAYDNFLEELGKMPDDTVTADEVIEEAAVEAVILGEKEVEEIPANEGEPNAEEAASSDDHCNTGEEAPEKTSAAIGMDENGRAVSLDIEEPQFVKGSDGHTTEIIDETIGEGQPLFSQPNYIYIPSTEQVQEDIIEQSDPAENRPEKNVSGVTNNFTNTPRPEQTEARLTTNEQAERLNAQPVSGTDPNEQLTGRSFEGIAPPPVSETSRWQGSRGKPADFPRSEFKDYEDYQRKNPGKGTIIFRVFTGRQAVPLENAECVIYTRINGEKYELARLYTNSSGQTPVQGLAAPNKALSQHYDNEIQAFALYDAKVTKQGFSQVILEDIPVFDGVQSVQKVFMIVE